MTGEGILFVIALIILFIGVPIGPALCIGGIAAYVLGFSHVVNAQWVYYNFIDSLMSYPLLAVPLFILSGMIMARGGIAKKIFEFFAYFMGAIPGGLPVTCVITCLFYGALSGSGPATAAAVGAMVVPYLMDLGYEKDFSVGLVTTAGGLGVIIPPSIPFVIYALSANVSVGEMFVAGILPGVVVGICLSVTCIVISKKHGEDRERLKTSNRELRKKGLWSVFKESFWALLTPVIILGGIYGGIVTPTEAAAVSVIYSVIVSLFIYKTVTAKEIPSMVYETAKSLAPMQAVVGGAVVFGRVLTLMQLPVKLTNAVLSTVSSTLLIMILMNIILVVTGMFVNVTSSILILTPVLLPMAKALGMDPVHFGIMMVVNLCIGFVTPPVGGNLFVSCNMFDMSIMRLSKACVPFIISFVIALIFVAAFPQLSLALLGR